MSADKHILSAVWTVKVGQIETMLMRIVKDWGSWHFGGSGGGDGTQPQKTQNQKIHPPTTKTPQRNHQRYTAQIGMRGAAPAEEWVQKVKDLSYRCLEKQQERTTSIAPQDLGICGRKEKKLYGNT